MYTLLIKQFIRSKIALIGIGLLLLCGIVSLVIGRQYLQKQQEKIATVTQYQQQHIQRTVQFENKEMGLTLYYLRFAYINSIVPINALSIGQRDVNLGIQQITIRTLEEKKYDSDLHNPASIAMGNFDFSFVLIFLFPLLIITFCYNIISEEKENGTWALVRTQGIHTTNLIWKKFLVRYLFIIFSLVFLLLLSVFIIPLPLNAAFLAFTALSIGYCSFWFALCAWVVSWQKNSNTNAISLLTFWLLLTIIIPAGVNNFLVTNYPVPEAFGTAVANRDGYHRKWDESKEHTMEKFYAHYPQFKKYTLPKQEFNWLWYYAMQQMGDDDAATQSNAMQQKLTQRNNWSNSIGYFIPTIHTQLQSNAIAQSGLENQMQFLAGTTKFHEEKRLYFYPKIFEDAKVLEEDWSKHKVEYFTNENNINWIKLLLPQIVALVILLILTKLKFNKND
jgi:ABC-2 type transport system permease protein